MSVYLGIDIGTQGAKALVYDVASRQVLGRGARAYDLLPVDRPGAAEQHPATWLEQGDAALAEAIVASGVDPASIRGIGVSGQQHGFVALDDADQVIRPAKLWCDTETAPEAAELSQAVGRPIPAGFTAPKILWLKRHEPESFARLRRVLLPHDYYNLHLCGRAVMECGDASGTGFFDPLARSFDAAAMAAVDEGLAGWVPELVGPDEAIGTMREELAGKLGLRAGVKVAPGSGDNMMSALGAGAVSDGVLVLSLGTSGTLFGCSARPVVDPEGLIAAFCDATGAWLPLLCTMNCTTITEEVRKAFGLGHDELTALAAAEPAGSHGLTFLPYLAGERAPDWPNATGTLCGLRPDTMRPGLLFRAAMEGASLALRQGAARLAELGTPATELRLVGGGSRNPLWRQILADSFQQEVRLPAEPDSAALGGALQAAAIDQGVPVGDFVRDHGVPLAPDVVVPDPVRAADYQEALARFTELGQRLFAHA